MAHTPMLDLGGLLVPGATVRMTRSKPGGKTSHAVQLVRVEGAWVGANPCLGNRVAKAVLERGLLSGALLGREGEEVLYTCVNQPEAEERELRRELEEYLQLGVRAPPPPQHHTTLHSTASPTTTPPSPPTLTTTPGAPSPPIRGLVGGGPAIRRGGRGLPGGQVGTRGFYTWK